MSAAGERVRMIVRATVALVLAAAVYEAVARSGLFPAVLVPTLPKVAATLVAGLADGSIPTHALTTLYRVLLGFSLAVVAGLPLGILMARFRPLESFFLPLVSALMPIPSLAWAPVFILWFGLGNTVTVLIVFYAAMFPMLLNAWSGVRSVNPLWLRAAGAMGANEQALFWKVIIPGASPFIITGLRLGPGLGHLRRQGVPQRRRHARLARGDRLHRPRVRAPGVRLARAHDRAALGHGAGREGMTRLPIRERAVVSIRKIEDYCLNPAHPRGRTQSQGF